MRVKVRTANANTKVIEWEREPKMMIQKRKMKKVEGRERERE